MVMDETHVVNQMKEDTCYVSSDFTADVETARYYSLQQYSLQQCISAGILQNLRVPSVASRVLLDHSLSLSGACHEDVAASRSRRHAGLSIARRLAVARLKLSGRRSSTILSQVCLGLPVLRRQSLGEPRMQARRAREWS